MPRNAVAVKRIRGRYEFLAEAASKRHCGPVRRRDRETHQEFDCQEFDSLKILTHRHSVVLVRIQVRDRKCKHRKGVGRRITSGNNRFQKLCYVFREIWSEQMMKELGKIRRRHSRGGTMSSSIALDGISGSKGPEGQQAAGNSKRIRSSKETRLHALTYLRG